MRRLKTFGAALALQAGLASCSSSLPVQPAADLVIASVRVIDTETGSVSAPQDVLVADGVVVGIRGAGDGCPSGLCEIVDASGQYLIPGLWDLHVHLEAYRAPDDPDLEPSRWHAPLAMSYGVLGLRDLGSRTDEILTLRNSWNAMRAAGEPAPVLKVAGQSFSGKQPWGNFDHTLIPETPEQAEEMVRSQLALGVDFIKVHDFLEPEIYAAITAAAVAEGRLVAGHLRPYSGPLESAASGQRDFDHLPPELLAYCGPNGEADTLKFYDGWYTGGPGYYERSMAGLYDTAGCRQLFDALAVENVSVTPTLSVRAPVRKRSFVAAQSYLPETMMQKCNESKRFRDDAGPSIEVYQDVIAEVMTSLKASEVRILAGTDGAPESCGIPGLVLLDEMEYLVEAGMSRQQVLDAATRLAAEKAGALNHGTVSEGSAADFVLLDADPLQSFAALEDPAGIVSAGRYLGRERLADMRKEATAYALSR